MEQGWGNGGGLGGYGQEASLLSTTRSLHLNPQPRLYVGLALSSEKDAETMGGDRRNPPRLTRHR